MNSDPSAEFKLTVERGIEHFRTARLLRKADVGSVTMFDYHTLLTTLFHQTYSSPYTFALAAFKCDWRHEAAKEYLLQHAEEERTHWRWVLDDLRESGYVGKSPRSTTPHPSCQAYIGLNEYIANHQPVARLAIAAVLEGIGSQLGGVYGRKLVQQLSLKPHQATFFLSHAETDKTHVVELMDVISSCNLDSSEWTWMRHAADCAGQMYRAMYDHDDYR